MSDTTTFDATAFKAAIRDEWRAAAPGWDAWHDTMEAEGGSSVLSHVLVEQAHLGPGDTVLDVGTGYGEPARTAARAIAPGGTLLLQDIAPDMLAVARERVHAADPDDVELEWIERDVEELELQAGSLDAIVSRAALMLTLDVPATLARFRSWLRPGGRLAASVWAAPDAVGFAAPLPIILDELELPPPPKDRPSPFTLADRRRLASLVRDAGFERVAADSVEVVWRFPSRQACTRFVRDVAPPITALVADRPDEVQQRVWQRVTDEAWEPFVEGDGRVRLRNLGHWVAGTRPA